ncbi:MAG: hypothetical protein DMG64_06960 [Acidobacteria bacterium]|nr:MAG: hypothetical protein DMG64_06960 [Acidobacteriota bacterium]
MQVARVAVPPVIEKRNAVPWLFFVFGCLVFAWLFESNPGYALGVLVCGSIVVAVLESAYAGMYWCTAAFAALAVVFNPFVHILRPLDPAVAALAMVALSPMLLLFVCRKAGSYIRSLPDGTRFPKSAPSSRNIFPEAGN